MYRTYNIHTLYMHCIKLLIKKNYKRTLNEAKKFTNGCMAVWYMYSALYGVYAALYGIYAVQYGENIGIARCLFGACIVHV